MTAILVLFSGSDSPVWALIDQVTYRSWTRSPDPFALQSWTNSFVSAAWKCARLSKIATKATSRRSWKRSAPSNKWRFSRRMTGRTTHQRRIVRPLGRFLERGSSYQACQGHVSQYRKPYVSRYSRQVTIVVVYARHHSSRSITSMRTRQITP